MKNKTKLDINIQQELIKYSIKKLKVSLLIMSIMLILLGIYIYRNGNVTGLGLALGGFVVIIIFVVFLDKIMIKQYKNNSLFKSETYNYYEFKENEFIINTFRDEKNISQSSLMYSDLIKVVENKNYIFMFISNAQAFVLSKNEMTDGRVEDLIFLLKSKANKYKFSK